MYRRALFSVVSAVAMLSSSMTAHAADGSSGGGSGSGGSTPTTGGSQVTTNAGAGQLEGNYLAANQLNGAAAKICKVVKTNGPGAIVIIPGTDRPDVTDWLAFRRQVGFVKAQFDDVAKDFATNEAAFKAIGTAPAPVPVRGKHTQANDFNPGKALDRILIGLAPTSPIMTGFAAVTTVAQAFKNTYSYGGATVTYADYNLATAVGGALLSPAAGWTVSIPNHADASAAADAVETLLLGVSQSRDAVTGAAKSDLARGYISNIADDLKIADVKTNPNRATQVAQLNALSANLTRDMNNMAQAEQNYQELIGALNGAAPASQSTAKSAKDSSTSKDTSTDKGSTNDSASTATPSKSSSPATLYQTIVREKALADMMLPSTYTLYVNIAESWGGYYSQTNLFTFFGKNPLHVAGGSVVNYALYNKSGMVASGFIPLISKYANVGEVASIAGSTTGDCHPPWL